MTISRMKPPTTSAPPSSINAVPDSNPTTIGKTHEPANG